MQPNNVKPPSQREYLNNNQFDVKDYEKKVVKKVEEPSPKEIMKPRP